MAALSCQDCARQGRQCSVCAAFERVRQKYKPVWDAKRERKRTRAALQKQEREQNFKQWGADKSLPPGDK